MSITAREAFELGFLQYCADNKLDSNRIDACVKIAASFVKSGAFQPERLAKVLMNLHTDLNEVGNGKLHLGTLGLGAAGVGIPMALGYGAGTLARKLQGDFLTPEDVKKQELINEMKALNARNKTSPSQVLGL